jgi:uncharacterized protein (TIGR03435 family)
MKIAVQALLGFGLLAAPLAFAQPSTAASGGSEAMPCVAGTRASFDVVSIKPSQTSSGSSSMRGSPDGVVITGSLRRMILSSFSLHDFQVTGGPDWVSTATWVVSAKDDTPDPDFSLLKRAELQALYDKRMQQLQTMLMDRFQLKCHMTAKDLPIYELVEAKGGAKLKPTTVEASKQNSSSSNGHGLQMHATATGVTAARIATLLTSEVDRLVVDKTGLTGSYDLTLDWQHDAPAASTDVPSGPTIFTALEEQLGLKLVPAKGPVPVLVIDAVEKPSEN